MSHVLPRTALTIILTTAVGSWAACAAREPHDAGSGSSPGARALVWLDEFDSDGLPDSSKWDYEVGGHGWGNKELQFYTGARRENARVEDGHLVIEARRDFFESHEYTSARLLSKAQWMSGRFEVRAKLPCARGTWPAIWMLPAAKRAGLGWPDTGEIDIMEHVGHDPGVIHASIHTGAYNWPTRTQKTATLSVPDACSAFHTYALDWTPSGMRAYVDDREYFQFPNERVSNPSATIREWPFDVPFAFRLNVAVGGMWGGEQGVDAAAFPQRMEIDFVRVYRVRAN